MAIKVGLRVTGIYFGSPLSNNGLITVSVPDKPTVKDVLDAAVQLTSGGGVPDTTLFAYSFTATSGNVMGEVTSFTVVYSAPPLKPSSHPASVKPPGVGLYTIREQTSTPYELALQYYHYRRTQVNGADALLQLNIDSKFFPFDGAPQQTIEDGDEITWRLVTIQNAAIPSIRTFAKASRSAGQMQSALL